MTIYELVIQHAKLREEEARLRRDLEFYRTVYKRVFDRRISLVVEEKERVEAQLKELGVEVPS